MGGIRIITAGMMARISLGLTGSTAARTHVEICHNDAHEEVREIAEEAMEELGK